jgi:hypothetical protein
MNEKWYLTHTLLKTLAFPSAEWLWALEPGFQCDAAKGRKARIGAFFLWRLTLSFFRALFSLRKALTSAKAQKKRGRPPCQTPTNPWVGGILLCLTDDM